MHKFKIARNIALGVKNLMLHKLRSFLAMLGVVFGVGSVVAMLAVGEGASRDALDRIRKLGSNNIIISSVKPAEEEGGNNQRHRMPVYGLLYEDQQRINESFAMVERTVPAKLLTKEARLGRRELEVRIVGTTPDWFELVQRTLIAGRPLLDDDIADSRPVCVLTEQGARKLLATRSTIGQTISIVGNVFEVVGIVKSEVFQTGNIRTPDMDADVYIPLNVARKRYGDMFLQVKSGSFLRELVELHQIIVQVRTTEQVASVASAIDAMMKRFHKKSDYRISVPLALLREAEATKRTFNIVLGSIAGISLLVGGIGIMNIMLASVSERTREIGIRRAIGARRNQIIGQFLIETAVLSTIGGLIGIGVGVAIPTAIEHFAGMPTVVSLYSIVLSVGISMAVGIVFGLYPAVRAANLDPIVALRHE